MKIADKHEINTLIGRLGEHLRTASRLYPQAWRQYDLCRDRREELGNWPEWCFCPLAASYSIVCAQHGLKNLSEYQRSDAYRDTFEPVPSLDLSRLGALGAWRVSQGIHLIDPTVLDAVMDTPPAGEIPTDVLLSLPEWCVYVPLFGRTMAIAPGQARSVHGFFAHLEYDSNDGRTELRMQVDWDGPPFTGLLGEILHLQRGMTLEQNYERMLAEMIRQAERHGAASEDYLRAAELLRQNTRERIGPFLSILLYLCSRTAEYRASSETVPSRPSFPAPKKMKGGGWRLFPPDRPKIWIVGERLGRAIRDAYAAERTASAERAGPRPHVRRAHWHTYWLGSKDKQSPNRRAELRWLPPIAVALEDDTPEARIRRDKLKPVKNLERELGTAAVNLETRSDAPSDSRQD